MPTLLYFINGVPNHFTGGKSSDAIVTWILAQIRPGLLTINTLSELESKLQVTPVASVLFSDKDSKEAKRFELASESITGAIFILSTSLESAEKFNTKRPSIILFKHSGDPRIDFSGEFTQHEINKFIELNKYSNVLKFDPDTVDLLFKDLKPMIFLFSSNYNEYEDIFESLSREFKGIILFCQVDISLPDQQRLSEYLGIASNDQPTSVILNPNEGIRKYRMSGDVTKENLRNFIIDWKEGKLSFYLKSEKIPKNQYEKDVRVLVGNNFRDVVIDEEKDVLVEFYAPWCGHCQKLTPHIEMLAKELKGFDNIIIAKIDATANEVYGVEIAHFPTIMFYPSTNKKGIEIENKRDFDSLLQFIKENSNLKIKKEKLINNNEGSGRNDEKEEKSNQNNEGSDRDDEKEEKINEKIEKNDL